MKTFINTVLCVQTFVWACIAGVMFYEHALDLALVTLVFSIFSGAALAAFQEVQR